MEILEEVKGTSIPVMALIDGDWVTVQWSENCDDMSTTGIAGFKNEENLYVPEDVIEDVRYPEDNEADYIMSDDAVRDERLRDAEEMRELELLKKREENRKKRQEAARRKEELRGRYQLVFDMSPGKKTVYQMRKELKEYYARESLKSLGKIMSSFNV